ncbi:glycosyltransferase [Granulicella cerasi]|uniref:Glycosyltransferase n=1 Tax=Granulicella cerasi TaxID=741063 RepID=A0ABW1Z6K0_9BACT|nr:glycosyltransferase family 2 protein [Granulicella cerasi]
MTLPQLGEGGRSALEWLAYGVCAAWMHRAANLVWHIDEVPDLASSDWEIGPARLPSLAVIVPAKDEEANLRETLETLRMQEYPYLRVIVVDDRSTDGTGAIADEFAAQWPERFEAIHIAELPEGWLGKTWALEVGMQHCRDAEYVLCTDADILFSPSILWRALAYIEASDADHLVVLPTPVVKGFGESVVMSFFPVMAMWAVRPWKVADPKARRDVAGVGAFNLMRRSAFEELGGWLPQRMVVLEDVTVGRRFKAAGMRQRVAFAPGMVLVHWAKGMGGIVRVMTKNLFSGVNFRPLLLLGGCAWIALFFLVPITGLFWVRTLLPSLLVLLSLSVAYSVMGRITKISARFGWAYPVGAAAMIWAMLRSMLAVVWRRGVVWRGTFYPLAELRAQNSPFRWERESAELRDRLRREKPSGLRIFVDRVKGQTKKRP